jgi:VCBS repeat-containing protein
LANSKSNFLSVGDLTGDGLADILIAVTRADPYYEGQYLQLFVNKGNGVFEEEVGRIDNTPFDKHHGEGQLYLLDVNGDGTVDIVHSTGLSYSDTDGIFAGGTDIFLNDGTGFFKAVDPSVFAYVSPNQLDGWGYTGAGQQAVPPRFVPIRMTSGPTVDLVGTVLTPNYGSHPNISQATLYLTRNTKPLGRGVDETLIGSANADLIWGLDGNDTIDGGTGIDTAAFSDKFGDVTFEFDGKALIVKTKTEGIDRLTNIETLKFSDRTLSVASVLQDLTPVSSQLVSTPEDTPRTITLAENTSAPVVSKAASHGTTSISGGTVIYTPAANYNGNDSFVVTASDGKGGTATQTINISVTPVNDAPVFAATSQAVSATAGAARTIALAATDVDGDALTYTVAKPGKGTASISGSTLTYTPGATASGSDSFVVTASDGKGGTATQTINATVALAAAAKAFTVNTLPGWVGSVGGNGSIVGSNGFEDIKVLYGQIALDGSFNRGGDIVRVLGKADSYVIGRTSASSAYIEAGTTTKVTIPIGSTGLGIVYDDGVRKLSFSGGAYKIGSQTFSADPTKITSPTDGTALPTGANPSTQAVVSLLAAGLSGGTAPDLTITGKVRIVGTNGVDVIKLGSTGGDLTFDGSFNRGGDIIILNKAAGDYSAAKFSGSTIVISSGIEKLTIPMGSAGLTLRFTDGDRTLVFKNSAFNIGDQIISSATATPLTPSSITLSADQGVTGNSAILDATGKVIFTDDAAKTSNVILKNFGTDDIIRVTGATASQYNFAISALDPKDLEITYTDAVTSATNTIVLDDVIKADVLIENYATAATALGWNFMAFG